MGYGCSAFSFIRIDMIHHQKNILLCQIIKAASLWQDTTYQLMIHFTGSLLVRCTWIAVKYIRSAAWNRISFSIAFGFENSLPLSVRITGNNREKSSFPRTLSNRFIICMTDAEVFESRRNASIKLVSTKCIVSRHLPPTRPITLSICTTADSGFVSRNFWKSV